MKTIEIEKLAEEKFGQNSSQDYYKQWIAGAKMVNERQPYTAEDIIKAIRFGMVAEKRGKVFLSKTDDTIWIPYENDNGTINYEKIENDRLIKLWEESRNG